jgi:predicted oxidoreductase
MGIGGSWDNVPISDTVYKVATEAVLTALEQGITLFDNADIYASGKSEVVFGRILKENKEIRDKIIIQSKCGIRFKDDPTVGLPQRYDFSYEHIINSVNGSLDRLGIEQMDILLLHRPDPLMEPEEVAKAFDEVHKQGKVKYFGVSNFNKEQISLLQNSLDHKIIVNQIEISLLHHHAINDGILSNQLSGVYAAATGIIDYCRLNEIKIQAWSPVANGKLFSSSDDNQNDLSIQLAIYAEEKGTSKEAIAISWLLRHPARIQPIIGTTNKSRIINSCEADKIELTREEWYNLFSITRGSAVP